MHVKLDEFKMVKMRFFGEISGIAEGAVFSSYEELNRSKIHTPTQAGTAGSHNPNNTQRDNWSSRPNTNPYTGKPGTKEAEK